MEKPVIIKKKSNNSPAVQQKDLYKISKQDWIQKVKREIQIYKQTYNLNIGQTITVDGVYMDDILLDWSLGDVLKFIRYSYSEGSAIPYSLYIPTTTPDAAIFYGSAIKSTWNPERLPDILCKATDDNEEALSLFTPEFGTFTSSYRKGVVYIKFEAFDDTAGPFVHIREAIGMTPPSLHTYFTADNQSIKMKLMGHGKKYGNARCYIYLKLIRNVNPNSVKYGIINGIRDKLILALNVIIYDEISRCKGYINKMVKLSWFWIIILCKLIDEESEAHIILPSDFIYNSSTIKYMPHWQCGIESRLLDCTKGIKIKWCPLLKKEKIKQIENKIEEYILLFDQIDIIPPIHEASTSNHSWVIEFIATNYPIYPLVGIPQEVADVYMNMYHNPCIILMSSSIIAGVCKGFMSRAAEPVISKTILESRGPEPYCDYHARWIHYNFLCPANDALLEKLEIPTRNECKMQGLSEHQTDEVIANQRVKLCKRCLTHIKDKLLHVPYRKCEPRMNYGCGGVQRRMTGRTATEKAQILKASMDCVKKIFYNDINLPNIEIWQLYKTKHYKDLFGGLSIDDMIYSRALKQGRSDNEYSYKLDTNLWNRLKREFQLGQKIPIPIQSDIEWSVIFENMTPKIRNKEHFDSPFMSGRDLKKLLDIKNYNKQNDLNDKQQQNNNQQQQPLIIYQQQQIKEQQNKPNINNNNNKDKSNNDGGGDYTFNDADDENK